jgi:O-antigen ligase
VFFSKIKIDKFLILLLFAVVWFAFIALITKNIYSSQTLILNFLNMIPMYLILTDSEKMRRTFFNAVVVGLLIYTFSFTGYYFKDIIAFDLSNRLGSFFGNQNDVAATLLIASTIFFYFFIRGRYYYVIPFIFAAVNLLSTGSRAGLLNLGIVLIFMFFLAFYRKNKKILLLGFLVAAGLFLILVFSPVFAPLKERLFNMIEVLFKRNTEADNSTMQRYNAIFESMYLFLLSPVFGNFISLTQFTSNQMVAHNVFLEIGASQGVISLFIFIAAFVYPFIKVKNSDHKNRLLFGSIIAGSILFHFTLTSIPFKEQYLILVLSMAYVSTSFVEFDVSAEIVKLKLIKRIHYIKDSDYFEESNLLANILFSKKQLIFLSSKFTDIDGLLSSFLDRGINAKVLSLEENELENINEHDLYIIDAFDAKKDEHLKLLFRIQQKTNYKLIVINDEPIYQNGVFNRASYAPLVTRKSFMQTDKNSISQKKTKTNKVTKPIKLKISKKYSLLINSSFSFLFTFLSIFSVYFANIESNLGSKIILIILSVAFYFQMNSIIFSKEQLGYSWQKKMIYYTLTTLVPISLFIIASFITAINIKLTASIMIYMSFVAVSSFVPIFIKNKDS